MPYIVDGYSPPPEEYGNYGYGSWFSSIGNAIGGAFKTVTAPIRAVGRAVDPTYSKSLIGRIPTLGPLLTKYSKQTVGVTAAMASSGLTVLAGQKGILSKSTFGVQNVVQGLTTQAVVAAAYVTGGTAAAAATGLKMGAATMSAATAPPATAVPVVDPAAAQAAAAPTETKPATNPLAAAAAGAAGGFLLGGPPGALIGGGAGYFLTRPKA